jgi:hypothetical protein
MKLDQEFLDATLSYNDYVALCERLVAANATTGADQSELFVQFTKLNLQRMNRINKTGTINEPLFSNASAINFKLNILIITEAWCGDAAQIIPFFNLLTKANPKISVKTILRDEYPELINQYLTNGAKAIPIALFLNEANEVLAHWGPRPKLLQAQVQQWLTLPKEEKLEKIHSWYAIDKGKSLQEELLALLHTISL